MTLRWFWLLAVLPGPVTAFEVSDLAGLDLQVDAMSEPVQVDGAVFRIRRASGAAVADLVERIRQRWRTQGSPMRESKAGDWHLLSRWRGQTSEVLQWRVADDGPEAVLSTYLPGSAAVRITRIPFTLPGNCAWGRIISGRAGSAMFEQHSAYCTGSSRPGWAGILAQLARSGWHVNASTAESVHAIRRGRQAVLTRAARAGNAGFALVWVETIERVGALR